MDKKSILIKSIQQIAGVEGVSHLCISPESENFMVVEIHFDPETVVERLTPEEVALRNYNSAIRRKQINDKTNLMSFIDKIKEETWELLCSIDTKNNTFDASELADISHVCDSIALHYGIDLQAEKEAKMLYNE
jgi:hypothetical protein